MEMVLVKIDSNEWNYMWNWIINHPINDGIVQPEVAINEENGEMWQYMGSFRQDNKTIHEFRHRSHPSNGDRIYLKLNASDSFSDNDIEKVLSVN